MRFVFKGTLDELKETIHLKAKEYNKDIVIYNTEPNILEIGFQRLGHSGGRFFIANITEDSAKVILDGETKNVFPNQKKSKLGRIWTEVTGYLFAYSLLEILLIIPWIFLKDSISFWIPLILPVIYLIIRHFLNKKKKKIRTKILQDLCFPAQHIPQTSRIGMTSIKGYIWHKATSKPFTKMTKICCLLLMKTVCR